MEVEQPSSVDDAGASINALYSAHYLGLVRLAAQLVDDQETAEDLVQDVFTALHSRQPQTPLEDPLRYLRTAVLNRSRSLLRRRRVARSFRPPRAPSSESADEPSLREAEHRRVLAAIGRLPARQRETVVLRYYEDLPIPSIAAILKISPGAVSSSLSRALASLHISIGDPDA